MSLLATLAAYSWVPRLRRSAPGGIVVSLSASLLAAYALLIAAQLGVGRARIGDQLCVAFGNVTIFYDEGRKRRKAPSQK